MPQCGVCLGVLEIPPTTLYIALFLNSMAFAVAIHMQNCVCLFCVLKIKRHFLPLCLCHSASTVAVSFALFPSISLFPHSLSLAAAQQPLALQIQPLISDLGGCLGEEGYWLHVCVSVRVHMHTCVHLAVYVGHLRASWHCRGGGFTTGPLLQRYYRGSRFPGKRL